MLSEWDKQHVDEIMSGHGDWFTAQLMRLVMKADISNRHRLRRGFPEEVSAVEKWAELPYTGSYPREDIYLDHD